MSGKAALLSATKAKVGCLALDHEQKVGSDLLLVGKAALPVQEPDLFGQSPVDSEKSSAHCVKEPESSTLVF